MGYYSELIKGYDNTLIDDIIIEDKKKKKQLPKTTPTNVKPTTTTPKKPTGVLGTSKSVLGSLAAGVLEGAGSTAAFGADLAMFPYDLIKTITDDNYKYRLDSPFPRAAEFQANWDKSPTKKAIKQTFDVKDGVLNEVVEEIGTFLVPLGAVGKVSKTAKYAPKLLNNAPSVAKSVTTEKALQDMGKTVAKNIDDALKPKTGMISKASTKPSTAATVIGKSATTIPDLLATYAILEIPKPAEERMPFNEWAAYWLGGEVATRGAGAAIRGLKNARAAKATQGIGDKTVDDVLSEKFKNYDFKSVQQQDNLKNLLAKQQTILNTDTPPIFKPAEDFANTLNVWQDILKPEQLAQKAQAQKLSKELLQEQYLDDLIKMRQLQAPEEYLDAIRYNEGVIPQRVPLVRREAMPQAAEVLPTPQAVPSPAQTNSAVQGLPQHADASLANKAEFTQSNKQTAKQQVKQTKQTKQAKQTVKQPAEQIVATPEPDTQYKLNRGIKGSFVVKFPTPEHKELMLYGQELARKSKGRLGANPEAYATKLDYLRSALKIPNDVDINAVAKAYFNDIIIKTNAPEVGSTVNAGSVKKTVQSIRKKKTNPKKEIAAKNKTDSIEVAKAQKVDSTADTSNSKKKTKNKTTDTEINEMNLVEEAVTTSGKKQAKNKITNAEITEVSSTLDNIHSNKNADKSKAKSKVQDEVKDKANTVELTNASKEITAAVTALDKIAGKARVRTQIIKLAKEGKNVGEIADVVSDKILKHATKHDSKDADRVATVVLAVLHKQGLLSKQGTQQFKRFIDEQLKISKNIIKADNEVDITSVQDKIIDDVIKSNNTNKSISVLKDDVSPATIKDAPKTTTKATAKDTAKTTAKDTAEGTTKEEPKTIVEKDSKSNKKIQKNEKELSKTANAETTDTSIQKSTADTQKPLLQADSKKEAVDTTTPVTIKHWLTWFKEQTGVDFLDKTAMAGFYKKHGAKTAKEQSDLDAKYMHAYRDYKNAILEKYPNAVVENVNANKQEKIMPKEIFILKQGAGALDNYDNDPEYRMFIDALYDSYVAKMRKKMQSESNNVKNIAKTIVDESKKNYIVPPSTQIMFQLTEKVANALRIQEYVPPKVTKRFGLTKDELHRLQNEWREEKAKQLIASAQEIANIVERKHKGNWLEIEDTLKQYAGTAQRKIIEAEERMAQALQNDAELQEILRTIKEKDYAAKFKFDVQTYMNSLDDNLSEREIARLTKLYKQELERTKYREYMLLKEQANSIKRSIEAPFKLEIDMLSQDLAFFQGLLKQKDNYIKTIKSDLRNLQIDRVLGGKWSPIKAAVDTAYESLVHNAKIKHDPVLNNFVRTKFQSIDIRAPHEAANRVHTVINKLATPTERHLFEDILYVKGAIEDVEKFGLKVENNLTLEELYDIERQLWEEAKQLDKWAEGKWFAKTGAVKRIEQALEAHKKQARHFLNILIEENYLPQDFLAKGNAVREWYVPSRLLQLTDQLPIPEALKATMYKNKGVFRTPNIKGVTTRRGSVLPREHDYEALMYDYYRRILYNKQAQRGLQDTFAKYDLRSVLERRMKELTKLEQELGLDHPKVMAEKELVENTIERFKYFMKSRLTVPDEFKNDDGTFEVFGERYRAFIVPSKFFVSTDPQSKDLSQAAYKLMTEILTEQLPAEDVDDVLSVFNGRFSQLKKDRFANNRKLNLGIMYLPESLADTLDIFFKQQIDNNPLYELGKTATQKFKHNVLLIANIASYVVNNTIGDFLKLYHEDPITAISAVSNAVKKVPTVIAAQFDDNARQALKRMDEMIVPKEIFENYSKLADAFEIDAINFIPDNPNAVKINVRKLAALEDVIMSGFASEILGPPKTDKVLWQAQHGLRKIGTTRDKLVRTREDWLRVEKFRKDLERVIAGKSPMITNAKAGKGLHKIELAGWASRATLVDYGAVSPAFKKYGRDLLFPFATFYVKILPDYVRWFKNNIGALKYAAKLEKSTEERDILKGAAIRLGFTLAPFLALNVWNNTGIRRDVEKNLPMYIRKHPHIIIDSWVDQSTGESKIITLQSPLVLALGAFGLDNVVPMAIDSVMGNRTADDIKGYATRTLPTAAAYHWLGQLNPLPKSIIEASINQQFYGDPTMGGMPVVYGKESAVPVGESWLKKSAHVVGQTMPLVGRFGVQPAIRAYDDSQIGVSAPKAFLHHLAENANRAVNPVPAVVDDVDITKRNIRMLIDAAKNVRNKGDANKEKLREMMVKYYLTRDPETLQEIQHFAQTEAMITPEQYNNLWRDPTTIVKVYDTLIKYEEDDARKKQLINERNKWKTLEMIQYMENVPKAQRETVRESMQKQLN